MEALALRRNLSVVVSIAMSGDKAGYAQPFHQERLPG